jgi:hypothetical protein
MVPGVTGSTVGPRAAAARTPGLDVSEELRRRLFVEDLARRARRDRRRDLDGSCLAGRSVPGGGGFGSRPERR